MLHPAGRRWILSVMRRWIAWVGFVVGCYNPTPQPGLPCAENDACPGGQTCVVGVCRLDDGSGTPDARTDGPLAPDASIDGPPADAAPDGPPADLDGDGIANAVDNCPTAQNLDQHDEDNDSEGDVCDNCPHIANATQANVMEGAGGADAVGDACDPNPTTPGDTIARFIPFHVMPTGVTTQGTWAVSGDSFVKSGMAPGELIVSGVRDRVTIEVGGAQIASATAWSGLILTFGEAAGKYHYCGYDQSVDDIHDGVLGEYDGTNWNWIFATRHYLPSPLAGAYKITVVSDPATDHAICTTSDARGIGATGSRSTPALTPGTVGIRIDEMSARLDYLIIFGTP